MDEKLTLTALSLFLFCAKLPARMMHKQPFTIHNSPFTIHNLRFTGKCLLLFFLLWLVSSSQAAAKPAEAVVDWRFGVIESYDAPAEASNLGVGWTRVRFQWAEVQAGGPGTWTPTVSEAQINGEIGAGRMVVGLLIGIPGWANDGRGLPSGLSLPYDDPNNTWANFVREAVGRYNGRISHWIIWNEPDIADPNAPGHTWNGTIDEFVQLQRTAYLAAKQVNPNAVIHLPAITYFWDPGYIYNFFDALVADPAAAEHNYYFDVMTAHLYFQPNTIYDIIQTFYGAMIGRGIPWKPLWLVETNAPPIDDPSWPVPNWTLSVTEDEQAAFVPQALASALAAGAERIAIFKMKDVPGDREANPEPFGLIRMDGSRRPAYTTYQVAIRYLAGMQGVKRERWNEVGQIRLDQAGFSTTVLFARLPAPQQAEVPATADSAVLVTMWGERRTITAQNGKFVVDLPGALCTQPIGDYCMIGGSVYYLVQATDGEVPAAPGLPSNPATTATPAGTAGTETAVSAPTATLSPTQTLPPTATPTSRSTHTPRPTATPSATATQTASPIPSTTPTASPTATETAVPATATTIPPAPETAETVVPLSYWFIGAGLVLGAGLMVWSVVKRP